MHAQMIGNFFDQLITDEQEEMAAAKVWDDHKELFLEAAIERVKEDYDMKDLLPDSIANDISPHQLELMKERMKEGLEKGMRIAVDLDVAKENFEGSVAWVRKIYKIHKAKKALK